MNADRTDAREASELQSGGTQGSPNDPEPELRLYKAGSAGYIGQLFLSVELLDSTTDETRPRKYLKGISSNPHTVIVLDNSVSMGTWSGTLLHEVFPKMLEKMGKNADDLVSIITFSDESLLRRVFVKDLATLPPGSQGCTYMSGVFDCLKEALKQEEESNSTKHVQILVISDGAIHDMEKTISHAAFIAPILKDEHTIDCRAVRLFTSASQPDTRALASILQFNTEDAGVLNDISCNNITTDLCAELVGRDLPTSTMLASLFGNTESGGHAFSRLRTENCTLQREPWAKAKDSLRLKVGKNTFWLKDFPESPTIGGCEVKILYSEPLTQSTLSKVLDEQVQYFTQRLKLLKVVDSESARLQMQEICSYFRNLESSLAPEEELAPLLKGGNLRDRGTYIRKTLLRRIKSVSLVLEGIANDDRVRQLNKAQQAEFLRTMDVSKNSKALAKRASKAGLEFDSALRKEIMVMTKHISELDGIDDTNHAVSFFSRATTLEGIKELCEMARDKSIFEHISALELLRVFNLVGIPAQATIGDYPDPMTYRCSQIVPGNYISVADLTMCELQGGKVMAPGTKTAISNAIPIFDDLRIQKFLQKHAPNALEYAASIGMRRVLAAVPKTYPYTICAGIWKLVEILADRSARSEINVASLSNMLQSYNESLEGYFDYLMPIISSSQDPTKEFFLNFNGITNMINPLWRLIQQYRSKDMTIKHLPRIMRSLYSYEIYQAIRRYCKHKGPEFIPNQLDRLLGVDYKLWGTQLPEMFKRSDPLHSTQITVDGDFLSDLCKLFEYVRNAVMIPSLFEATFSADPVNAAWQIPSLSEEMEIKALDLNYPLEDFLLYNIVQGFLFQSKQSRIDKDSNKPLLPDLGNRLCGLKMCRDYIKRRYEKDYTKRLGMRAGEEKKLLRDKLLSAMAKTSSKDEFCKLLQNGITRGVITIKISNITSDGANEMHDLLLDARQNVPQRIPKLIIWYSGVNENGEAVWNGGNVYRKSRKPLKDLMLKLGEPEAWEALNESLRQRVAHVYRHDCPNRHGHSNELPSFFAFGYQTLKEFYDDAHPDDWTEYVVGHSSCCGVADFLSSHHGLVVQEQCFS